MVDELSLLCEKYGSDKCPQLRHNYTPFYYELFKERKDTIKKVIELGIGAWPDMAAETAHYDRKLKRMYQKGASLKMWRDFFPNAEVHGIDWIPETMIDNEERITTHLVNQNNRGKMNRLLKEIGADADIFIDDGSHLSSAQVRVAVNFMPLLKQDVVYIIEDVKKVDEVVRSIKTLSGMHCEVPLLEKVNTRDIAGDNLVIVKK